MISYSSVAFVFEMCVISSEPEEDAVSNVVELDAIDLSGTLSNKPSDSIVELDAIDPFGAVINESDKYASRGISYPSASHILFIQEYT